MTMRITFNQVRDGVAAINTAAEQFAEAQWQVSTGKRVRTPSDDPTSAQRAVNEQATIDTLDGYRGVADSAAARLAALDSVLGDMVDKLTQALVAAQSAVGSTASQAVREAAAESFTSVRDALASSINTSFNGAFLFGGGNASVPPYVKSTTWAYQGNGQPVSVDVGENRSVALTFDGRAILQGGDATDVLTTLDGMITAARAGDGATILAGITSLNNAFGRVSQTLSQVGRDQASVDDGNSRLAALRLAAKARLSQAEEANMPEAITRMNRGQMTYEAALGAVAKTSRVSLLDYLK